MDDFYKGLAYVCLYKSDTGGANAIDIDEITLTFAVSRFPREVLKYLNRREGHTVEKVENGMVPVGLENKSGFNLPATGGMGTYLFTIGGLVIMAGAVLLLITSKKKRA